jgi:hypothetical protein
MKKLAASLLATALMTGAAHANIISFFQTQRDTDFVSAGVGGLRGTGTGEIVLSGVSGTVNRVYLYWHGPTNSTDPNFNATITFNGVTITGENIGFSDDNFWGQLNSQAYRADVTALVGGDGDYTIAGLSPDNTNGASLLAFFDDGDDSNNRDVVLFDGNDANFDNAFDPIGWDIALNNILYGGGDVELQLHVSDGQNFGPNDDGTLMINGSAFASGGLFQGDSTPATPGTSVGNGSLWDIRNFDLTALFTLGINNLSVGLDAVNDALSAIVAAINLPAGAAPPDPDPIPVPPAALLLLTGAGVMTALRRRKKTD